MADRTVAVTYVEKRLYAEGEPNHDGWLPTDSTDQSCAFCGAKRPVWVHPLDARYVGFQVPGSLNSSSLPTFWTTCESCEVLIRSEDDDALVEVLLASEIVWQQEEPGTAEAAVAAFRRADIGAQPLGRGTTGAAC